MTPAPLEADYITAYERAVCYYTLPRITRPLHGWLILVYGATILCTAGLLLAGVVRDDPAWMTAGANASAVVALVGLCYFFAHAILNDTRTRSALASAHIDVDTPAEMDIPDPFADHRLLRHSRFHASAIYECSGHAANPRYEIKAKARDGFAIVSLDGDEVCEVSVVRGISSFAFTPAARETSVHRGGQRLGGIRRNFDLYAPSYTVEHEGQHYLVRRNNIFFGGDLIGRIYYVRHGIYLDIAKDHFNESILAYFVL